MNIIKSKWLYSPFSPDETNEIECVCVFAYVCVCLREQNENEKLDSNK